MAGRRQSQAYGGALQQVQALKHARDVSGLIRMLNNPIEKSAKSTIRAAAARALGEIADSRACEPLRALMDDPAPRVRFTVAYALGRLGDREACQTLLEALADDEGLVRDAAAISLGKLGCNQAVPALREALDANTPWTRLLAAQALHNLGDVFPDELLTRAMGRERWFAVGRRFRWRKLKKDRESAGREPSRERIR